MRSRMRLATLAALFALTLASRVSAQTVPCSGVIIGGAPNQLRAALEAFCMQPSAEAPLKLDEAVQYAGYNAASEFVIAYNRLGSSNQIEQPLRIARFDKLKQTWTTAEFSGYSDLQTEILPGLTAPCMGAVGGLQKAGALFYLSIDLSPSAACTVALSSDLRLQKVFSGWIVANFANGTVLLEGSTVHFAPTHPLRLSLFNPSDSSIKSLYPVEKDPLRARYIERLRTEIVPGDRCEGENCEWNPERFDDELANTCESSRCRPAIAVNNVTGSLAFTVQFSSIGFLRFDKEKDSPKWGEWVVFVYRLFDGRVEYREFPASDMQTVFAVTSLDELLQVDMLKRVFDR